MTPAVIHFAARSDATEHPEEGEALCTTQLAGDLVAGDWTHVTCTTCYRLLAEKNRREAEEERQELDRCAACDDGRKMPADHDRTLTFEDNSVQVYCARCGRCIQA